MPTDEDLETSPIPANYLELTGISDESVSAKTGRTWPEWVRALDGVGAHAMEHKRIAAWVFEQTGLGWWSQSVAVGYERIRGLRQVGQRRSGEYEASRSKTFAVSVERLFEAFADDLLRDRWLTDEVSVSKATPSRSVRMRTADGVPVDVYLSTKGEDRSTVQVQLRELPSKEAAEQAKAAWSEHLAALEALLG